MKTLIGALILSSVLISSAYGSKPGRFDAYSSPVSEGEYLRSSCADLGFKEGEAGMDSCVLHMLSEYRADLRAQQYPCTVEQNFSADPSPASQEKHYIFYKMFENSAWQKDNGGHDTHQICLQWCDISYSTKYACRCSTD